MASPFANRNFLKSRSSAWLVALICTLTALSAWSAREVGVNNRNAMIPVGPPDSVWSYLESAEFCPETGGPTPGKGTQDAQDIWVGGRRLDGGVYGVKTQVVHEKVCNSEFPSLKQMPFCSTDTAETVKSCDAAAKIFGVSSAALMCSYGASTLKLKAPEVKTGGGKNQIDNAMTEKQQKEEEEHYKTALKKYEKLTGKKDKNGNVKIDNTACYDRAKDVRQFLNMIWPAVKGSNFFLGDQCDFNRTVVLMAIHEKWGSELGLDGINKLIQLDNNGVKLKDSLGGDIKKLAEAVLKCMSGVEPTVGGPGNILKGSCESDVWN